MSVPVEASFTPDYINDDISRIAQWPHDVNTDVVENDVAFSDGIATIGGMKNEANAAGHTFGSLLKRLRKQRRMSVRALELRSGVANIPLMERELRGVPRPKSVHALADALDCTPEERFVLFERALGDRVLKDVQDYSGYLFMGLALSTDSDGLPGEYAGLAANLAGEVGLSGTQLETALERIAQEADRADQRAWLATYIFSRLSIDLENRAVIARLAPFAASRLDAGRLQDEEAGVSVNESAVGP
jgi:transcriptional regulator with XRE-family HTH domain